MALKYCKLLAAWRVGVEPPIVLQEPSTHTGRKSRTFQLSTAKDLTLAEYNPISSEAITAHRIADYRRRHFSLTLLPDVHIWLDELLAPSEVSDVSL